MKSVVLKLTGCALMVSASVLHFQDAAANSLEELLAENEVFQIIEESERMRSLQLEGIEVIEVTRTVSTVGGFMPVTEYFEVIHLPGGSDSLRPIPQDEVTRRYTEANQGWERQELAAALRAGAIGHGMVGSALEQEMAAKSPFPTVSTGIADMFLRSAPTLGEDGDENAACNTVAAMGKTARGNDPTGGAAAYAYYTNPAVMMTENACFLLAAADVFDQYDKNPTEEMKRRRQELMTGIEKLHDEGLDILNSRSVRQLSARDLGMEEVMEDGEVIYIDQMQRWIDTENGNDVKLRLEGRISGSAQGGRRTAEVVPLAMVPESSAVEFYGDGSLRLAQRGRTDVREFYMEREFSDFRQVPGSNYIHPYRETIRMGGMLGPEELAQLKEAEAQMADFEKQMASMPADQRAMMERMMGPQLEQMRSLVNQGTFETVITTTKVTINPDFKMAAARHAPSQVEDDLLARIQRDLTTLGYQPGNTVGNLDKPTVAAIISFQRDNSLDLTGKPSPQLAGILAAKVKQGN